jgi:hypothetical protein
MMGVSNQQEMLGNILPLVSMDNEKFSSAMNLRWDKKP